MTRWDPTREELELFTTEIDGIPNSEISEFAREEAIYWFAYDCHMGQASNLYSVLSTSPFRPGLTAVEVHLDGISREVYRALVERAS